MTTYKEILPRVEEAATAHYVKRAQDDPGLHEFARYLSQQDSLGFQTLLGEEFEIYQEQLETGFYRIIMDFTQFEPGDTEEVVNMVSAPTICEAFMFLTEIYGRDWKKVMCEFALLATSLEVAAKAYSTPQLKNQEARFGFLFALALDTATVTGLQRPEITVVDS